MTGYAERLCQFILLQWVASCLLLNAPLFASAQGLGKQAATEAIVGKDLDEVPLNVSNVVVRAADSLRGLLAEQNVSVGQLQHQFLHKYLTDDPSSLTLHREIDARTALIPGAATPTRAEDALRRLENGLRKSSGDLAVWQQEASKRREQLESSFAAQELRQLNDKVDHQRHVLDNFLNASRARQQPFLKKVAQISAEVEKLEAEVQRHKVDTLKMSTDRKRLLQPSNASTRKPVVANRSTLAEQLPNTTVKQKASSQKLAARGMRSQDGLKKVVMKASNHKANASMKAVRPGRFSYDATVRKYLAKVLPASERSAGSSFLARRGAHGDFHSTPSRQTPAEEDVWVRMPSVSEKDFFSKMMQLMAARPYRTACCPNSEAEVLRLGATIKPLGQTYNHQHPHYDAFWLLAHSVLNLVKPEGLLLEFGVAQGSSATLIGGIIKQSSHPKRTYYGFDVFTGLPEAWGPFKKGAFANPNGELPRVPEDVTLVKGLFNDTLPPFLAQHPGPASLINIDCDLYAGAIEVLRDLTSRMVPGTILHFHEINQVGVAQELKALKDWLENQGKGIELEMLNLVAWGEAAVFRVVSTATI